VNKKLLVSVCVSLVCLIVLAMTASAQAPTLQEQLAAQYKVARIGSDSSGYSIIEEGTLLEVKKGGIIGVPYKNVSIRTATYQDGTVHAADTAGKVSKIGDKLCGVLHKCSTPDAAKDETTTKLFKVGDKVYASKIDVHPDKDSVAMTIVACDTCNQTDPPTYNKAIVVFQFPKGSLATTSAADVENMIGQLLAVSDSQEAQAQNQQGQQQDQSAQPAGAQQAGAQPQPQQQAEPQTIEVGMTPDQVTAAMGQPEKIIKLTSKQIYVYKDMKVTFVNGKVSDVQ
jgi:hypothetical protein